MGKIMKDLKAVMDRDPAARNKFEVFFTYGGFQALFNYRFANWFYRHKMKFIARWISSWARFCTGVDIHPGAKIGTGVFIDHGVGVVIGETAEIGNNVTIYQGVTLGGTGKDVGKRHPTIEDDCMICAGAKVLGPFTVGKGSKIGAGSVVLKEVPPYSTVVGIPGRIVKRNNEKVQDMDQVKLPDPILDELTRLNKRIEKLESMLNVNACKYSITNQDVVEVENLEVLKREPKKIKNNDSNIESASKLIITDSYSVVENEVVDTKEVNQNEIVDSITVSKTETNNSNKIKSETKID